MKTFSSFLGKLLRSDRRGAALVEFGIIAPLLFILTLGVIDFGRVMWYRTTLEHAAREGVRFAAVRGSTSGLPATQNDVETFVENRAVGITPANLGVTVSWAPNNNPGGRVTVRVTYDFTFFLIGFLPIDPMELRSSSTMTIT